MMKYNPLNSSFIDVILWLGYYHLMYSRPKEARDDFIGKSTCCPR